MLEQAFIAVRYLLWLQNGPVRRTARNVLVASLSKAISLKFNIMHLLLDFEVTVFDSVTHDLLYVNLTEIR